MNCQEFNCKNCGSQISSPDGPPYEGQWILCGVCQIHNRIGVVPWDGKAFTLPRHRQFIVLYAKIFGSHTPRQCGR